MPNQESGEIKQLKLRIPMELYVMLEQDAEYHRTKPSTHARHLLVDGLMNVQLTPKNKMRLQNLIKENWARIRKES